MYLKLCLTPSLAGFVSNAFDGFSLCWLSYMVTGEDRRCPSNTVKPDGGFVAVKEFIDYYTTVHIPQPARKLSEAARLRKEV